jgi:hypothetical protein
VQFKYQYKHLTCRLCTDFFMGDCEHLICPHIMENLNDLRHDPAFTEAVQNAESCETPHKTALMTLKAHGFKGAEPEAEYVDEPEIYGEKPECLGCPYPRHGFICHFRDGTCLKTSARPSKGGEREQQARRNKP